MAASHAQETQLSEAEDDKDVQLSQLHIADALGDFRTGTTTRLYVQVHVLAKAYECGASSENIYVPTGEKTLHRTIAFSALTG